VTEQVVETASGGRHSDDRANGFRAFLIAGGAAFMILVLLQVGFAVFVTPVFADMYADSDLVVRQPQKAIFALSHNGVLVMALLAFDAALFGVMYLLARRYGRRLLFVPAAVLLLISFSYIPLTYMPMFDSMTVAK
jgi:hypothetical protein